VYQPTDESDDNFNCLNDIISAFDPPLAHSYYVATLFLELVA
jgi:hypothetical protein